jgi:3-deoxy-D-manno-octulosonic acid kinase
VPAFINQTAMKSQQLGKHSYYFNQNILSHFDPEFFSSNYWQLKEKILGAAHGRGTTWFIEHPDAKMVLRHYYRGGLIGKLITDAYCYTGLANTRAVREFNLLEQLNQWQLPCPRPIALHIERSMLSYRADILIELIGGAKDLVGLLTAGELDANQWQQIGRTIREFHNKNVYHHDLNAHNIMIDAQGKIWLIDFDRGEIREDGHWKEANLARLERSFNKERARLESFHYQESNFLELRRGYQAIV